MASKGKQVATGTSSSDGKRKRGGGADGDNSGSARKRRNREILQFFEDSADVDEEESDESDYDDDEFDIELKVKNEPTKMQNIPFIPKEEMYDEEFDKMMEERYKEGSNFVTYTEDAFEVKSMEINAHFPSSSDPCIWKVKCMVGRERNSAFCLMQKFADLKSLGTKLQIISAFAVDHIKGFIYIEADKQCDINEACKGLCSIYSTRVALVPKNEVSHLLSVRSKPNVVSEGMWARIKNGKYKGDLAQVVAVNDARKRATVKLIPRIDLQALAQKFGGGISMKNAATPAPRLLCSSELEEFRPLIRYKHDRDTGKMFENLDGLMLKDGYLYKKVSIDSLSCWGVMPSEEELLKFQPSANTESDNSEWLKQIYGTPKKKRIIVNDKGGEKGETSSGSCVQNSFGLYDLVCFGRKDFGLIVGMEKDDYYKILKDGPEAPVVVTVGQHELKIGPCDMKFIALDRRLKTISINDTVRVVEGPLKDRQGIAKQIYRGIIFMYNQNEEENGGYFCSKAQMCEKIKLSFDACSEKGGGSGTVGFEDLPSSPKSPLSPKRPWQTRESSRDFNKGDKDGMFSIGQTLRIRVGPLKGYLCSVLAIRYSDVTVKLGSQQKVLTVKCEHLSEVRGKSSAMPVSDDHGSSSFKPFDLGTEGGSKGWTDGAGTSAVGDGWNTGVATTERSWTSFSSGFKLQTESNNANSSGFADNDTNEVLTSWERKVSSNQNSSWDKAVANDDQVHDWGKTEDGWNKVASNVGSSTGATVGWGKAALSSENQAGSSRDSGDDWGKSKIDAGKSTTNAAAAWDTGKTVMGNPTSSWGDVAAGKNQLDSWCNSKDAVDAGSWNSKSCSAGEERWNKSIGWNQQKSENKDTWGSTAEAQNNDIVNGGSWGKSTSAGDDLWNKGTGWNQQKSQDKGDTWGGNAESAWSKQDGGSFDNQDRGREFGGWKKSFDGVCGPGERRGRGGSQGGRDQFGRGRKPFGEDHSSGWKGGEGNSWTGDGTHSRNPSSWSNDQSVGWGKSKVSEEGREDGQKKPNSSWGDNGAEWNQNQGAGKEIGESWDKCAKPSSEKKSSWGDDKALNSNQALGVETENPKWKASKSTDGNWTSDWNKGSASNEGPNESWGEGSKRNTEKVSGNENATGKTHDSDWGKKGGSSSASVDSGRNAGSSWGQKSNWNSGSNDADANQESGWGKKSSWNSVPGDATQDSSGWAKKSIWIPGDSDVNRDPFGANADGQTENSSYGASGGSWRGGFRGRGGSDRGGFRGRGERGSFGGRNGSDGGGYGGRGRSDRGGFGRGGSGRGGFGGRGRFERGGYGGRGSGRRDQNHSWNENNNSGEGKAFDWKNGKNNDGEWKTGSGGSWNQGGADKSQLHSWNCGNEGTSNQAGGWRKGTSAGWESTDSWGKASASSWGNRGDSNEGGGGKTSGGGWKQGGADESQLRSWNSGKDGTSNQAGGWGRDNSEPTDSWGKASASSWGNKGDSKDGGGGETCGGSWKQRGDDKGQSQNWISRNDGTSNEADGWGKGSRKPTDSWAKASASAWENKRDSKDGCVGGEISGGSWNQGGADKGQQSGNEGSGNKAGGWGKGSGEPTDSWGKASASSWGNKGDGDDGGGSSNTGGTDKGQPQSWNSRNDGTSNEAGGWGKGSGEPTDSWGKASASSWGNKGESSDGGGKTAGGSWNKDNGN